MFGYTQGVQRGGSFALVTEDLPALGGRGEQGDRDGGEPLAPTPPVDLRIDNLIEPTVGAFICATRLRSPRKPGIRPRQLEADHSDHRLVAT